MSLSTASFEYVRQLVKTKAGIVIEPGKEYLVENRLAPLARLEGMTSAEELVASLRKAPMNGIQRKVVDAMTTNETSFFRDIHPFEVLKKQILPELAKKLAGERRLSLWCGASSTGQEPYSIAMLLKETGLFTGWNIDFLATDLSEEVLSRAKEGRYTQLEINRGLPAPLLVKNFEKQGLEWRLKADVRAMVRFAELNLTEAWPKMPACDIVFLRNVLIYFATDTKREILEKVRRTLKPDGYLFLGGAETTLNIHDGFEREAYERTSSYRVRKG